VLDREIREGGHLVVHLSDGNRHRAGRSAGGRCCDQEPALGGPKDRKLHRAAAMAALKASRVSVKKNGARTCRIWERCHRRLGLISIQPRVRRLIRASRSLTSPGALVTWNQSRPF